MKIAQPVLIQSFKDEFDIKESGRAVETPAAPNTALPKGDEEGTEGDKSKMRCGAGKLPHLVRWSRPEIFNAVREQDRRRLLRDRPPRGDGPGTPAGALPQADPAGQRRRRARRPRRRCRECRASFSARS